MPKTYTPRPTLCTGCGDKVLIAEQRVGALLGFKVGKGPQFSLEHADPAANGDVFDEVDGGCGRPPP